MGEGPAKNRAHNHIHHKTVGVGGIKKPIGHKSQSVAADTEDSLGISDEGGPKGVNIQCSSPRLVIGYIQSNDLGVGVRGHDPDTNSL